MNDRNKTTLTHRVTALAAAALDSLGCKPVETEVEVSPGWIADVASYWYPTRTEAKRFGMQKIALPSRLIDAGCDDDLDMRLRCWCAGPLTVLVEVKTTPADFRGDRKWLLPPPAHICIVAFPSGVVLQEDLPKGWYGLETNKAGDMVRKWHRSHADIHAQHPGLVLDFVAQVGIRRDHRSRYRAFKDWAKAYRAEDTENKKQYSAARLFERLVDWLQGTGFQAERPLRDILPEVGIEKVPSYLDPAIDYLESLCEREAAKQRTEDCDT